LEEIYLPYYLLELGTSWREGGRTAERGFIHLEAQIFIIQLETLAPGGLSCPDLSVPDILVALEVSRREAEILSLQRSRRAQLRKFHLIWRIRSSPFSLRLHLGVCLAPIYYSGFW
jgi:hypothetical protein